MRNRFLWQVLRTVVCLSVVCHILAPCINRSVDFDTIWHFTFVGSKDALRQISVKERERLSQPKLAIAIYDSSCGWQHRLAISRFTD